MRLNVSILVLQFIFTFSIIYSQTRYKDEIFSQIVKAEDVVYGNAPDLPFIFVFEWNTYDVDLTMDIYEAYGDTIKNRPVIIFLHPGAFFTGNNEVDDMVSLSISAAKTLNAPSALVVMVDADQKGPPLFSYHVIVSSNFDAEIMSISPSPSKPLNPTKSIGEPRNLNSLTLFTQSIVHGAMISEISPLIVALCLFAVSFLAFFISAL